MNYENPLTPLARRHAELSETEDRIKAEKAAVRAEMLEVVRSEPDTYAAGEHTVSVSLQRRLDLDAAAALVIGRGVAPESVRAAGYDRDKVRQHLTEVDLDTLMVATGEPRVVVK